MRRAAALLTATLVGCPADGAPEHAGTEGSSGGESSSGTMTTAPTTSVGDASSVGEVSSSTAADSGSEATSSGTVDGSESTGEPPADTIAVAAGYGTRRVRSDDGLVWTDFVEVDPNGGDDDNLLRGIGWGDGVFLAVGGAGAGFSMRSFDGVTWQDETHELDAFVSDVAWQDDVFVAAGGNGLRVRSLDGGVSWQDPGPYYAGHYRAIAAGNGVFVAVGHPYGGAESGLVNTTADGASWSGEQLFGAPFGGLGIAFGAGVFVTRDGAGDLRGSSDGQAWSEVVLDLDGGGSIVFADDQFVTAGDGRYWISTDGTQWDELVIGDVRGPVGWIEGQWLTTGWPATIDASADLGSWQNVFAPGGPGFTDIAVGWPGS